MSALESTLTRLEYRLRALIESSAARLIPFDNDRDDLSYRLAEAMRAGIQPAEDGNSLAPNLFTLYVHPMRLSLLRENQILFEELAHSLQQSGEEVGLRFITPPVIKVVADPTLAPHQLDIHAQITPQHLDETSALTLLPAEEADHIPADAFLIVEGDQVVPLTQPMLNIGRHVDNHLAIDDPRVSRLHAQLRVMRGRYTIFDLDSTGGTFVNQKRVRQCALSPGDVISLAGVSLVYGQDASSAAGETQTAHYVFDESRALVTPLEQP